MAEFKKASSNDTFTKVPSFKYDNGFNNWIDPNVLKKFTSSKKLARKSWKDSYGLYSTSFLNWDGINMGTANNTKCVKKCAKLVCNTLPHSPIVFNFKRTGHNQISF